MSVLKKRWEFIDCGSAKGFKYQCEYDSIFTTDGEKVLGFSEWIAGGEEIMERIINLHNATLEI